MKLELTKLQFKQEPDHDEDIVSIYTRMGVHRPGVPMGHRCMIAEVYCDDTTDPNDSAYQIAQLFISAPALLEACEELMELADNSSAYLKAAAAIAAAKGK